MTFEIQSKKALDRLGDALLTLDVDTEADKETFQKLNAYRIMFHPLMADVSSLCRKRIMKLLPKTKAEKVIVVQRTKRLESIIAKLQRQKKERAEKMQLSRMQDVGGVRVILPDIKTLKLFTEGLFERSVVVEIKKIDDYINSPKDDGYRGIHYVLEMENKTPLIAPFPSLRLELQVRTKWQHCWATGVEIMGIINNKNYKGGEWDEEWKQFFILLGKHLSNLETVLEFSKNNRVEKEALPLDNILQLYQLTEKLNVLEKLKTATAAFQQLDSHIQKTNLTGKFFLLNTDFELGITEWYKLNEQQALKILTTLETRYRKTIKGQTLLIDIDDVKHLKEAYPNYFMDTKLLTYALTVMIKSVKSAIKL
jgi:ppGpp synthetase/RelA/SpoT-type nucleotidyltranferase